MNLFKTPVSLPAEIVANNQQKRSSAPFTARAPSTGSRPSVLRAFAGFGGNFQTGSVEIFASTAPGLGHSLISFNAQIASITTDTFNNFRMGMIPSLGSALAEQLDQLSGISSDEPNPGEFMTDYIAQLFVVLFGGNFVTNTPGEFTPFDPVQSKVPRCAEILTMMHSLITNVLTFDGTLQVEANPNFMATAKAIIHVTKVTFSDGVVIPFTGYLNPAIHTLGNTPQIAAEAETASEDGGWESDSPPVASPLQTFENANFDAVDWRKLIRIG